jgi:hypothetical protein
MGLSLALDSSLLLCCCHSPRATPTTSPSCSPGAIPRASARAILKALPSPHLSTTPSQRSALTAQRGVDHFYYILEISAASSSLWTYARSSADLLKSSAWNRKSLGFGNPAAAGGFSPLPTSDLELCQKKKNMVGHGITTRSKGEYTFEFDVEPPAQCQTNREYEGKD